MARSIMAFVAWFLIGTGLCCWAFSLALLFNPEREFRAYWFHGYRNAVAKQLDAAKDDFDRAAVAVDSSLVGASPVRGPSGMAAMLWGSVALAVGFGMTGTLRASRIKPAQPTAP